MRHLRPYSQNRSRYQFRIDDAVYISVAHNLPHKFLNSTAALVETLLVNYENALTYYTQSKPAWDSIIRHYPENIVPIAKRYHPSLHYQFSDPTIHCNTKHGYYLRLRSFSIINSQPSISAELFVPDGPTVPIQHLSVGDIAPIYVVADFANI